MTIHEEITRTEEEIKQFMQVLPHITVQENKVKVNEHIITLSHKLHALRMEVGV